MKGEPIEGDDAGVAGLVRSLGASEADDRAVAAEALCHLGPDAVSAVESLVAACGDVDERVREWAVAALEEIGPPTAAAIPGLINATRSNVTLSAYWAVTLLGRAAQAASSAVGCLADCVDRAGDVIVRERAAWALGRIGPAAAGARESLARAVASPAGRLSRLAREALAAIDGAPEG